MKLNKQQQAAIQHQSAPLLIIAGAGTGKTTVICERIKYLIRKKKIKASDILALTFTEKSANEMLERLDAAMPFSYEEPWLSTFHAFCERILRLEGLEIGLSPDYRVISQPEQWLLVKKHLFDFKLDYYRPLGNPTKFIGALLNFFSRLQDENINSQNFMTYVKNLEKSLKLKTQKAKSQLKAKKLEDGNWKLETERWKELARAYQCYQKLKIKENVLDFGDLISLTLRLFRQRKNILKKYQTQFKHILVDEFQDTNFSQLQLIKLLAPAENNPNLVVVGDDFQSIYKWRGAAISNILDFKKHFPKAKTVILNKNYRSTQPLLDQSYKMIKNNEPETLEKKLNIDKSLKSQRKRKITPQAFILPSLEKETEFVVKKILELSGKEQYTYKDFAILARANNHLEPFAAALKRYQIPYQLVANRGLFDQEEIRGLLFFLKTVVDKEDSQSLFQLLHASVFDIKSGLILEMLNSARKERKDLWEAILEHDKADGLEKLVNMVKLARERAVKEPALPVLFDFINQSGYIKGLLQKDSLENQLKIKNINLFFNLLKRFETDNENNTLVDFIEYLDLIIEAGSNPAQAEIEDIDTVRLLTVHSAKGLEFPVVFLVNAVSDRFPTRSRRDPIEIPDNLVKESLPKGDFHLQEERRLFYVACTRAKDYLIVCAGKDYGGIRQKKLSGFVSELGVEPVEIIDSTKQLDLFIPSPKQTFKPRQIIDGKLKLDYVSYSQIDVFKTCPLKYKYRYILQVPTKPHHALTFGQSIHSALYNFHLFEQKGQKPDKDTLLYLYKKNFLPIGYDSEKHKKARYKKGKQALISYFKQYKSQFPGKPYLLEQKFKIKIGDIWLIGKIDRIDKLQNNQYELVDYKTGQAKEQNDIDKDAQLTIYKMAAKEALKIDASGLSLYFVEDGIKLTTTRLDEQLKAKKEEIEKTVSEIKKDKFEPKANYPFPCGYCEYNQICPFAKKS